MDKNSIELINSISFWKTKITISPVEGGITNQNFLVNDGSRKYFVRIGDDIPEHLVFRSNEIQASNAASKINVSPKSVSYTHLRAHETPEHLVCRLLLEKKNFDLLNLEV